MTAGDEQYLRIGKFISAFISDQKCLLFHNILHGGTDNNKISNADKVLSLRCVQGSE